MNKWQMNKIIDQKNKKCLDEILFNILYLIYTSLKWTIQQILFNN